MANERLFYDVWLIEPNLVYREVPVLVVNGWAAEGRVLGDDKVRVAGQANWHRLADVPLLSPHLVKPVPHAVEDPANEPARDSISPARLAGPRATVDEIDEEMPGAAASRTAAEEDDDPDMIPLIDISLVLLIFFLMTGKSLTGVSNTETADKPSERSVLRQGTKLPRAKYAELIERPDFVSVAITKDLDNKYVYIVADRWKDPLDLTEVLKVLYKEIQDRGLKPKDVTILLRADESLPFEEVQQLTIGLEALQCAEIFAITIEDAPGESP